jgi:hypothetical protein
MSRLNFHRLTSQAIFLGVLACVNALAAAAPNRLSANSPLPPNPGLAGKATLAGIDANSNGVRDDLEPFIQQHFRTKPRVLAAVSNVVISLQAGITARTSAESIRAQSMMIKHSECLAASGTLTQRELEFMLELFQKIADTPERNSAVEAHQQRVAEETFLTQNAPAWEAYCDVRADLGHHNLAPEAGQQ